MPWQQRISCTETLSSAWRAMSNSVAFGMPVRELIACTKTKGTESSLLVEDRGSKSKAELRSPMNSYTIRDHNFSGDKSGLHNSSLYSWFWVILSVGVEFQTPLKRLISFPQHVFLWKGSNTCVPMENLQRGNKLVCTAVVNINSVCFFSPTLNNVIIWKHH